MAYHYPAGEKAYGPYDGFYTEQDELKLQAQRAEARERERAAARQTQREIAQELSRITSDEYQEDVLDHMEQLESETMPDVSSIDIQTEIQWFMRPYLLDFLVEAHAAFQLLPETFYLTVNLLDRYCSRRVVYKKHYQLVGCSALLIAAKYGDRKERVPTVKELRSMCCSLYDEDMFTQMEWHVLATLNWAIGHPTVDGFLQMILSEEPNDREVEHLTHFICENALFEREFVSVLPSALSRSALALSRSLLGRSIIDPAEWAGQYDSSIAWALYDKLSKSSNVLKKKYASAHLSAVSITVDHIQRKQAEMSRRMLQSTTASGTSGVTCASSSTAEVQGVPHTPQKAQCLASDIYGYLTPPITPDTAFHDVGNGVKQAMPQAMSASSSLTPPPSAEQLRVSQCTSSYRSEPCQVPANAVH